jgi:hypothetical protein
MRRDILMTFLETLVLLNVVQVITTHNDCALHLRGQDDTLQDATTDGNIARERALFVHVRTLNGGLGCFEAQTDGLVETRAALFTLEFFRGKEDTILLLKGFFVLTLYNIVVSTLQSSGGYRLGELSPPQLAISM